MMILMVDHRSHFSEALLDSLQSESQALHQQLIAAIIYIYVNDFHEAIYFVRGTDCKRQLLQGRYAYTISFLQNALPPVDRTRGGFWSLTMYDKDYYMLPNSPNGCTNIGTVNLDANELKVARTDR